MPCETAAFRKEDGKEVWTRDTLGDQKIRGNYCTISLELNTKRGPRVLLSDLLHGWMEGSYIELSQLNTILNKVHTLLILDSNI